MSSHTSLEYKVCWMFIKILSSKFQDVLGTYRHLSHTSKLHFLVSTFLSTMSDVTDLLVLTFANCVLKAEWLSGLWNYTYVFFQNQKMTFYIFWVVAHIFSNTGLLNLTWYEMRWDRWREYSCCRLTLVCVVTWRYWTELDRELGRVAPSISSLKSPLECRKI